MSALWRKLLIVCPFAGLGSLTRLAVADYRSVPEARTLITRLKQEVADLAAADQATLEEGTMEETLAAMDQLPPLWRSSLQHDVESGHRSELEAILGIVCRKGRALRIPTPVADMIYGALLPADLKARRQ
jgi:2-dehydropantoate 2-reductase